MSVTASHAKEAMAMCEQMRAGGASMAEVARSLELHLRAVWTHIQAREYGCDVCSDSGVEVMNCPARKCARHRPHMPHEYVRPCFCAAGERWKVKPPSEHDAIAAAARTSKPVRQFTKAGR